MKRVAVFGNAGGGKSTLARHLADMTGLPLYVIDLMQFREGGAKVPQEEFLQAHSDLLQRDEWIIDGYGTTALAWELRACRYVGLCESAARITLRLGDQASHQGLLR